GVDRAVTVAGQVDRLVDQLLVDVAFPGAVESELDTLESLRPLLLTVAFDLDLERPQRLLELLEEQHRVQTGAPAHGSEQHLGRSHGGVVAEDRSLVDLNRMPGCGLDVEEDLVPGPAGGRFRHGRNHILGIDFVEGSSPKVAFAGTWPTRA